MLPNTPLRAAPLDATSLFGGSILSEDLIKGLRRINNNIVTPLPEHYNEWYPYKKEGATCLWLGRPGDGVKITAFHLGPVPEWTLMGEGRLLRKGWRAIFDRVIRSKAATRQQIEREFRVSLEYDGRDKLCPRCFHEGMRVAGAGASGLCDTHESVRRAAKQMSEARKEARWNRARRPKRMGPMVTVNAPKGA